MYGAKAKLSEEIVRYPLGCEPNLPFFFFFGLSKCLGFQFLFMQLHFNAIDLSLEGCLQRSV